MLSLSVPRLTSLASTSTFPSHRRHFLQRKPLSVSISTTTAKPSLHVASFKPSHLCRRFQLAAGADSLETEEEEVGGLEVTTGGLQVEGEEFLVPEEEEEEEGEEVEEYEEEEYEEEEDDEEEDDEEDFSPTRAYIVLKFIWMEKNIGLSLEMVIQGGKGTIPLTPYYFWPRKDAWEELKAVLEEKRWVSQKRMIILLNQATDIINLWQQSGVNVPTSPV
ncbi:hypothetical protein FCM35_KLT11673 [Carex littledalei]|uniref:30S ribosomal protein 3, chloroplastic n=1 Tax=Carex littledalei TaxID=544730 RepID=A0A833V3N9_9POAL|nr:hypothetical protein FCM35_KLT11673 [Carex littledalei]